MTTFCLHADVEAALTTAVARDDVLTFDDGHYNIYAHRHKLAALPNRKILFITPSYVTLGERCSKPKLTEYYQFDRVVNGNSQFMTLDEITELVVDHGFELGMHSYAHDLVYLRGQTPVDRSWRMHKLSTNPSVMIDLCGRYATTSALAVPGLDVVDGALRPRSTTEFEEYVASDTERCVAWFRRYLTVPTSYAFPFFVGSDVLVDVLRGYGVVDLYGRRPRVPVV